MALISIVTGGVQGIGRATVDALHARGDTVIVFDCVPDSDERVAALPQGVAYCSVDISSKEQAQQAVADVVIMHDRIDLVVNNAGITADGMAVRCSQEQWERVLSVNLNGAFWCAQAALVHMMRARSGCIINMSSVVASTGNAGQVGYASSKAALEGMTKSLAREYGARGIRVNAIAPGLIDTAMTQKLSPAAYDAACERVSMRRAGTPGEVADLVCFLSSSKSSYITGQIIHINGGMW